MYPYQGREATRKACEAFSEERSVVVATTIYRGDQLRHLPKFRRDHSLAYSLEHLHVEFLELLVGHVQVVRECKQAQPRVKVLNRMCIRMSPGFGIDEFQCQADNFGSSVVIG